MIPFPFRYAPLVALYFVMGLTPSVYGQLQLQGRVFDTDNTPLPYVNIGVPHTGIGTVSRVDGSFSIAIPDSLRSDTLWFSHVGYHTAQFPIHTLEQGQQIHLRAMDIPLPAIHVFRHKPRVRKIGTNTQHPLLYGTVGKGDTTDIVEHAKLIKINKPSVLLDASIYIKYPAVDSTLLRLNLYAVTEDGMPGKRVYHRPLIRKFPLKKGWLKFDLEEYGIMMEEPFFLGFEFLPDYVNGVEHPFTIGAQLTGKAHTRHSSNGTWEKYDGASSSAYVRVKQ